MAKTTRMSRRDLLIGTAALGAAPLVAAASGPHLTRNSGFLAISSGNGLRTVDRAMELMKGGTDTLDAAIAGVNIVELDPNDMSVGYGGLPNADGIVELDASVMHGPTYRAGAVASLRNIKTPSLVAKAVMERTAHVLLVGEGALKFAKMHGFKEEELLTENAREAWVRWKERHSDKDNYLDPADAKFKTADAHGTTKDDEVPVTTGTITCMCLNDKGDISGTTTTSGLSYKVPGRVGDSPIIGCGVYVENEVGACGSTGLGEMNILMNGSRIVVENMRQGMSPEEACLDVLKRIADRTRDLRLLDAAGRPNFGLQFYALNKNGDHGGGNFTKGASYAVNDGTGARLAPCGWLY